MGRDWREQPADLVTVMMRAFGIDRFTAMRHLHHGAVKINDYTICAGDAQGRWKKRQVTGKILTCPEGTIRLYGTFALGSEIVNEQLKLGR